jgi:hypothetical protein
MDVHWQTGAAGDGRAFYRTERATPLKYSNISSKDFKKSTGYGIF